MFTVPNKSQLHLMQSVLDQLPSEQQATNVHGLGQEYTVVKFLSDVAAGRKLCSGLHLLSVQQGRKWNSDGEGRKL